MGNVTGAPFEVDTDAWYGSGYASGVAAGGSGGGARPTGYIST